MTNPITIVFFDIGGVLLTDGWDTASRKKAIQHFGLDENEFVARHEMFRYALDTGRIDLDHYMNTVVFHKPRGFSPGEFREFMYAESKPFAPTIELVKQLRKAATHRLFTLNNESQELHEYRASKYHLHELFDGFLTSCYLGYEKPDKDFFTKALGIAHVTPEVSLFIDDRTMNVQAAAALGIHTIHHIDAETTRRQLSEFGIKL